MKHKSTNWDRYFASQMRDPLTRGLVEPELKALQVGARLAEMRERRRPTQPAQNLTLGTLVKVSKALNCEVTIALKPRPRNRRRAGGTRNRS